MHQAEFLITGRADWAMGYKAMGDEGSLLNAIEVKQRSEFSKGEAQLTANLAILRENRRRAKKVNHRTQGFYSDGTRFCFLCITEEGIVRSSRIFVIEKGDLKVVFSYITNMMEIAMKMTPTVTPTQPGPSETWRMRATSMKSRRNSMHALMRALWFPPTAPLSIYHDYSVLCWRVLC